MNACKFALDVQDACNVSGVLLSFNRLVEQVNADFNCPDLDDTNHAAAVVTGGRGRSCTRSDFIRNHPAIILYMDKMHDLMGRPGLDEFGKAYERATAYVEESQPKAIVGYEEHSMNLARDDHADAV